MIAAFTQVGTLALIMALGIIAAKLGWLKSEVRKQLTNILLFITTPMVILDSFQFEYSTDVLKNMGVVALFSIAYILVSYGIGWLFFRKKPNPQKQVLTYAVAFANVGYMGIPVISGLLGSEGVIYVSVYISTFTLLSWTLGVSIFAGKTGSLKKILLNPSILAIAAGLLLFIFSVRLPAVLRNVTASVGNITTPLSMMLIGAILTECNPREVLSNKANYLVAALRLAALPALALLACSLLGITGHVRTVLVLIGGMPTAANSVMFATLYGGDEKAASAIVVLTTVLFMLTCALWMTVL
ncbi:MAG: AEC family transporter [Christensenellales bacterium]|jgi:predicted permease